MSLQLNEHLSLSPYFVDNSKTPGFNWERFQDKIDALPEILYNLLTDEKTSDFIKVLTQKYPQLSVQGPDVARIIRDVVIADIYIGDMPTEISKRLEIDQNTAMEIARTVVSQLFAPVIEDIKKLQLQKFGKLPGANAPQPSSAPRPVPGADLPESGGNIIDLRNP